MSSEEYYNDPKYPGDGSHSQSSAPYAAYHPEQATYALHMPLQPVSGPDGYQLPPESYYGGYQTYQQQPPPPYYQHPAPQPPRQPPYQYNYGYPPQQVYQYSTEGTHSPAPQNGAESETQDPNERGALGALAGGAAGAIAGHQVHHGVLGTIGGAIAGSLAEDALKAHNKPEKKDKKEKKEKKSRWGFHRRDSSSSSSSSSSSDSYSEKDGHKHKTKPVPAPAPAPARAPAPKKHRGNFSHSSHNISLHADNELVATCIAISGRKNESRIPLSSVLTNEWGHFKWRRNGNFGASARNVRLLEGGKVLEAELADGKGGWRRDWITLDERVSNRDGELVFLE
ncbi:CVNH domain-containing protein [Aspergillus venezuelensis]